MNLNELIRKMIFKNNDLFKSLGYTVVPVFATEKCDSCNMTSISEDELVFSHSIHMEPYDTPIFAFRDWNKISSILGMFSDDLNIKIDTEFEETLNKDCPSIIRFNSSSVKIKHFLQSYKFYSLQEKNNVAYKKKKFILLTLNDSNVDFDSESLRQVSKAVSILNDKEFRLKVEGEEVYALIGDEDKSVDNITVKIGTTTSQPFTSGNKFSFEHFNAIFKSYEKMDGVNYVKIFNDKIVFTNVDDKMVTTTLLRSR